MALAEIREGAEVRPIQARHRHDVHPLLAGAGELARGGEAPAVAMEQERHPHARMRGREATLPGAGLQDGPEVEGLAHPIPDEVCHLSWRHELMPRRRQ